MKDKLLKVLALVSISVGFLSSVAVEGRSKEWGGFYGKISWGYGMPDVVKENVKFDDNHINPFLKRFQQLRVKLHLIIVSEIILQLVLKLG